MPAREPHLLAAAVPSLCTDCHDADGLDQSHGGQIMPAEYAYNSGTNEEFLSVEQLRELIRQNVDPDFKV